MSRQEFIDRLKAALGGSLSPSLVMDHVSYYEDYIRSEMQKGKSEEAVLSSLGDPRLIARTIIQTNTAQEQASGYAEDHSQRSGYGSSYSEGSVRRSERRDAREVTGLFRLPGWVWILVVVLILVMVFGIIMSVLSFLAPIFIPVVVVVFLIKLFRDWLN